MLNVEGKVNITKIDINEKYTKATIYFGTPRNDDKWDNSFFNAKLVGKAHEKLVDAYEEDEELEEKDSIFITSGIVTNKSYTDKKGNNRTFLEVTIFDFIYGQDMEEHLENLKAVNQKDKKEKKDKKRKERKER